MLGRQASLAVLNAVSPLERVAIVRDGIPAELLTFLADEMSLSREKLYAIVGVPRATADRKVRARQALDRDESERALGLARLVGQVQQIVDESGKVESFHAGRWVAQWLDRPNPALGGRQPAALMDTAEGRALVSTLVAQMQSGSYA